MLIVPSSARVTAIKPNVAYVLFTLNIDNIVLIYNTNLCHKQFEGLQRIHNYTEYGDH